MLSIKRSINSLEESDSRFRTALECYIEAIASTGEFAVAADELSISGFRKDLRQLQRKLVGETIPEVLREGLADFRNSLSAYRDKLNPVLDGAKKEIQQIVDLLAKLAGDLGVHSDRDLSWLAQFGQDLEKVARLQTMAEVRARLAERIRELNAFSEQLQSSTQAAVKEMEEQLAASRARLVQAEALASTDPLTAVANRREGERLIAERIQSGKPFCILLFDLDHFKAINDSFGHNCGDQVLKVFATRLSRQVRAGDAVCRWGGDEFLVILGCPIQDAFGRAPGLAKRCAGEHEIMVQGRSLRVAIECSVGVAGHVAGESSDELIDRADKMLYKHKRASRPATEPPDVVSRRVDCSGTPQ